MIVLSEVTDSTIFLLLCIPSFPNVGVCEYIRNNVNLIKNLTNVFFITSRCIMSHSVKSKKPCYGNKVQIISYRGNVSKAPLDDSAEAKKLRAYWRASLTEWD